MTKKVKFKSLPAYLMLIPGFVLLTIFVVIPLVMAVYRSFFNYNVYSDYQEFVGFHNYYLVLKDGLFLKSLKNAVILTLSITILVIVISFFLALLIQKVNDKLSSIARTIIYIPFLISGLVTSIIFLFITNFGGGLINSIRISLNKEPIAFAVQGIWPYLSIIIPTIWVSFGYNTLVFHSGMKNIPKTYYEAAMIDGANAFQRTWYITIPSLKNYFALLIIGLITANLQMFEIPFMMTGGGPLDKTLSPVLYLFNSYRDPNQNTSKTIAGAILLMIPIMLINLIVFKVVRSEKTVYS